MIAASTSHLGGRPVDPIHLEGLGKQAARLSETAGLSLSDAVVQTVEREKLNSEQVRRVVEFTNIEAFNRKFASLEGPMRAVQIDGGPADPAHVLQTLNDAASPQAVSIDTMEYSSPPALGKVSSIETILPAVERSQKGAVMEVIRLQSKLAAAHEDVIHSLESSKFTMNERLEELADRAKTASLQGASHEEIYSAWFRVDPEMAKLAFSRVQVRLAPHDGTKVAGRRINPEHPVVSTFGDFVKAATAFASYSEACREIERELSRVSTWLEEHGG